MFIKQMNSAKKKPLGGNPPPQPTSTPFLPTTPHTIPIQTTTPILEPTQIQFENLPTKSKRNRLNFEYTEPQRGGEPHKKAKWVHNDLTQEEMDLDN